MERRILNEFESKILNEERIERVRQLHKKKLSADYDDMRFVCECDNETCAETIDMSTAEYERVHGSKTKHFVVVPTHVRADLEAIVSLFNSYALVAKYFPGEMS